VAGAVNAGNFLNILFLQVLWFAAVLGAAHDWMTPALLWFAPFVAWHTLRGAFARRDLIMLTVAAPLGFALDTLWVTLGWLEFGHALPDPRFAPYWIVVLWVGLALTLNHSLRWLQTRLALASVLSLASAPLSYYAASRLGAAEIVDPLRFYAALGLSWGIVIPTLLLLARSLGRDAVVEQQS
jgi:hypothetical protein